MAIAFDAYTQIVTGSGTSQTLAHTCTGTDRFLVVGVLKQGNTNVTGVTYAGVAMTFACGLKNSLASANELVELWVLANPASGSNNIIASFAAAGTSVLSATSFTGCAQTGQPDSSNTLAQGSATTSYSVSTTTIADNSWLVGYFRANSGTFTAGSNTTIRETGFTQIKMTDSNAAMTPAGSYSQNATLSSSLTGNMLIISISPSTGAPTASNQYFTMMGVG